MNYFKKTAFLQIAESLNKKLDIVPLLYGSLGLEQRLGVNLDADDVDVLIPEEYLAENWDCITKIMDEKGYALYDVHEHAFEKDGLSVAFASIENLVPFAGVDIAEITVINENDIRYYLLDLQDYLKVYTASSHDGYRKNTKNKNDNQKIELINKALNRK